MDVSDQTAVEHQLRRNLLQIILSGMLHTASSEVGLHQECSSLQLK
jgi:hypothetical protein